MRILKRILKWGALTLLVLVVIVAGYSQYLISSGPDRVPYIVQLPADVHSLAEGARLARTLGCIGCHTENLSGAVFINAPVFARLIAPNLTTAAKHESVENLEAALRQGIGFDGRPLVIMPSQAYSYLTDEDAAKVIAYVRTVPEVQNDLPSTYYGPIARVLFATGVFQTEARLIRARPELRFDPASEPQLAQGEYLAMIMCSECHGADFNGQSQGDFVTPNLTIVSAYTPDNFVHLLKTGEGANRADLGLMSEVAVAKTAYLNEDEIQALYVFLTDRVRRLAANAQ